MQPYFFPYIGYFQLVASVDVFVFYDDASYSKNGWYNRNRILSPTEGWQYVRVAVRHTPLGTPCNAVPLFDREADLNRTRELLKVYRKAPYYRKVLALVEAVFAKSEDTLASISSQSIIETCKYLGITIQPTRSSELTYDRSAAALDKIVQICTVFDASEYLNLPGGQALYKESDFTAAGIKLRFIPPPNLIYKVEGYTYIPNLSILDPLMWLSSGEVVRYLESVKVT